MLGRFPETAQLHLLRGHALKTVGRTDEAITAYRKTYATNPRCGDAYWSLANLKTFRFSSEEVMAMSNQEASDELEIEDQVHFCFALGKHFEDRKDYARSFDYYNRGNELRRKQLGFSADLLSSRLALQSEVMSPELFARYAESGCQDADQFLLSVYRELGRRYWSRFLLATPKLMAPKSCRISVLWLISWTVAERSRSTTLPLLPG